MFGKRQEQPDKFSAGERVWVLDQPEHEYTCKTALFPGKVEQRLDNGDYLVRLLEQKAGKWELKDIPTEVEESDLAPRERKL